MLKKCYRCVGYILDGFLCCIWFSITFNCTCSFWFTYRLFTVAEAFTVAELRHRAEKRGNFFIRSNSNFQKRGPQLLHYQITIKKL